MSLPFKDDLVQVGGSYIQVGIRTYYEEDGSEAYKEFITVAATTGVYTMIAGAPMKESEVVKLTSILMKHASKN